MGQFDFEAPLNLIEPADRLAVAIDTSNLVLADQLAEQWAEAGGGILKLGLQLEKASSGILGDPEYAEWKFNQQNDDSEEIWPGIPEWAEGVGGGTFFLSKLAERYDLSWVYDGKIKDIGNTMEGAVQSVVDLRNPPIAITMHGDTSELGIRKTQKAAGEVIMLGVTLLTDIGAREVLKYYSHPSPDEMEGILQGMSEEQIKLEGEKLRNIVVPERADKLADSDANGLVASCGEVSNLRLGKKTRNKVQLIPGSRLPESDSHDQANVGTPDQAIEDGATILVIGREYTNADIEQRPGIFTRIEHRVDDGLERRVA